MIGKIKKFSLIEENQLLFKMGLSYINVVSVESQTFIGSW